MRARRAGLAPALVALLLVAAVACGDDDDGAAPPTEAPAEAATTGAGDDEGAGDEDLATVTVELSDFSFGDLPEEVTSSTRFLVENVSDTELHELVAFRLDADDDRDLDEIVGGDLAAELGSQIPLMVILAPPGGEQVDAIGEGTLPPGRYLLVCVIPTGADPDEYLAAAAESQGPPDVEGGPPHIAHGMYAEITVVEG